VFKGGEFPGWKVDLCYRALGLFGNRDAPLAYRRLSADQAAAEFPLINHMDRKRLTSTAVFREYSYFWPERILADTALDAERLGTTLRTYCAVTDLRHDSEGGWTLDLEEVAPGEKGTARVHGQMVINATGPWIDRLIGRVSNQARRRQTGIKGVNLLVRLPDVFRGHGLETISSLKHPFYMFPWGDHHYFGPTDTLFEGDPDTVRVEADEVTYLLGEANKLFPNLNLTEKDVVYRWAGVRPRTNSASKSGAKALTVHDLAEDGLPNMLAVTGTPIMVHRQAGREVAKLVRKRLTPSGSPQPLSYSAKLAPQDIRTETGVSEAEILYAARTEHVVTLADLMQRRLQTGWQPDMGFDQAERICAIAATVLDWSPARQKQECEAYRALCQDNFEPRTSTK
ncbi:MAG: FAD-dependent oxidoreductase, partial [Alphaproteobacteria bacterium]|nr:FAD-dependent oxidoreductase [Alphaproteobacteria bacterium]